MKEKSQALVLNRLQPGRRNSCAGLALERMLLVTDADTRGRTRRHAPCVGAEIAFLGLLSIWLTKMLSRTGRIPCPPRPRARAPSSWQRACHPSWRHHQQQVRRQQREQERLQCNIVVCVCQRWCLVLTKKRKKLGRPMFREFIFVRVHLVWYGQCPCKIYSMVGKIS
jgi:hypothetical protein